MLNPTDNTTTADQTQMATQGHMGMTVHRRRHQEFSADTPRFLRLPSPGFLIPDSAVPTWPHMDPEQLSMKAVQLMPFLSTRAPQ